MAIKNRYVGDVQQPVSADDINAELGQPAGSTVDFDSVFGTNFNQSRPHGMLELFGQSALGTFTYTTAQVSGFSVAQDGTVTTPSADSGTITSTTYSSGYNSGTNKFPLVSSNTSRTVSVSVRAPSSGYLNNNAVVTGTETATQVLTESFVFSDWTGTMAISSAGGVSISNNGNLPISSISYSPLSFTAVNTATDRDITVTLTAPSGYFNSGNTVSGTKTVEQPAQPTFQYSDWTGTVSISEDGDVSATNGNASSVSVSPTSFDTVGTDTDRTVTVTVTVPSGYYNVGNTVSDDETVTQPAITFNYSDWTGVVSINTNGDVSATNGNASSVSVSPTSYTPVENDIDRSISVTVTVPDGYSNTDGTVSGTETVTQPGTPLEFDWFFGGVEQSGTTFTATPSTTATSYSIGFYAYRASTAIATDWELDVTAGSSFITVNTTTSGGSSNVSTTTTQNTNGTPYLYINVAANTGSARNGSVEILKDGGALFGTITINQSGVSNPPPGNPPPPPGNQK